ncbi:MAG: redox-regulated ATPase YchF [Lentimicrobiaceae bacterium]|jgi:GTP-binding protein YchF|nr:redox-regulated ATPase YchF [Lentimicrobiaceae bacterium]MDG1901023.1 redox-regulated ATPase YchF [Bacteroidales bacterium]MDG2081418.1 redox-regulated ATPase YchF [Bacteroidales bacterium]|tara:strand:+ start:1875 stop:2972 length:1098 start_codon:yes stop_codon:yes gene_type:complete
MSLNCGIIGLANTGKTTIFNCMSNTKAQSSNYAFSATKSNIGIVNVPDPRLYKLDDLIKSEKVIPATIEIVDVPGLSKGASEGEGVGNKFLSDIQKTDALVHVLRCFDDDNLAHIEGSVDPVRDIEIVDFELQVRDLDLVNRKIERLNKLTKSGDKEAKKGIESLTKYKNHLENFGNVRTAEVTDYDATHIKDIQLLTDKTVIYVCNVDDSCSPTEGNDYVNKVKEFLDDASNVLVVAGEIEAEISELEDEMDRKEFLTDAGLEEPGVNRLVRAAYDALNLMSFFTAGPKEVRAWTIKKGMKAPEAAGVIHSDLERGFIRSEVIKYDDYMEYGSEQAVKDAGKFHVEGKNYIVEDADVMHIRFNV